MCKVDMITQNWVIMSSSKSALVFKPLARVAGSQLLQTQREVSSFADYLKMYNKTIIEFGLHLGR